MVVGSMEHRDSAAPAVARVIIVLAMLTLLCLFVLVRVTNLDGASGFDEGIYASGLLLLRDGMLPHRDFFHAQGPLFLPSLLPFYIAAGETLSAARFGVVIWSLVGLLSITSAGWWIAGDRGAFCSMAACALSGLYLSQSRALLSEMPSLALATSAVALALAYQHRARRGWLLGSALLLACGVLIKALVIGAAVPVAVAILAGPLHSLRGRLIDGLIALCVSGIFVAGVILVFDAGAVWDQAVQYHLLLKQAFPLNISQNLAILDRGVGRELRVLLPCALLGLVVMLWTARLTALGVALWLLATAGLLLTHSPLFDRHAVALLPPLALACGGLGLLFQRRRRSTLQAAVLTLLVAGAAVLARSGLSEAAAPMPRQPMLEEAADVLAQLTGVTDTVVTDNAALAFAARRALTPPLADLSRARMRAGDLSGATLWQAVERWQPSAVAWWFGYVAEAAPELQANMVQSYSPVWGTEGGRYLAVRGDGQDLPETFLSGYRPSGRLTFGDALQFRGIKHAGTGRAGTNLEVRILWNVIETPLSDWDITLIIRRNSGDEAGRVQAKLGEGWARSSTWRRDTVTASYLVVPLDRDARDSYRVFMELREPNGQTVVTVGSRVRGGDLIEVSRLDVEPR
ncbi:MAG: ArnT family glycosyltransferase [Chloroflexota bacterium]